VSELAEFLNTKLKPKLDDAQAGQGHVFFVKRCALYGRYHPTFNDFRAAIQEVQDGLSTKHAEGLATLMKVNFQQFEDVSLMAA
jgi:hypothetical protein